MNSVDTNSISDRMSSESSLTISSPPTMTTISTIALQSGSTRLVIAVLQSGHFINLRILEMNPNLATIGRSVDSSEEMFQQHEDVLEKLRNKQSPVEELLQQADKIVPNKNPEVYAAMAESLGIAWRDVNSTLELRRQILQKAVDFQKNRTTCLEYFVELYQNKKEALITYRYAVEDGRRLIDKLKEVVKEEPAETVYSIGLVNVWLDELRSSRSKWQENLKAIANQQKQKIIEIEFEKIIQEIEEKFANGFNVDQLRNRLLHLSSTIDKSDVVDSSKSHLQRIIYNLIERITINMELIEEIQLLIKTNTILDTPDFRHIYEEKLQIIETFQLQNIDDLKAILESRVKVRKNYEKILENPLDYDEAEVEKQLTMDPTLDITTALERIKIEKRVLEQMLYDNFSQQINELEDREEKIGYPTTETKTLIKEVENTKEAMRITKFKVLDSSSLLQRCRILLQKLQAVTEVDKFLNENNILDAGNFKNKYSSMRLSDVCRTAPERLQEIVTRRIHIQEAYDAMLEDPMRWSDTEIRENFNRDSTLDTNLAFEKLNLLRNLKPVVGHPVHAKAEKELFQSQSEVQIEKQIHLQAEFEKQKEEAELERQRNLETEGKMKAELEQQKKVTAELERQRQVEAERRRQLEAELERQRQVEAERQRQAEAEIERQLKVEAELKRQRKIEAELELQRKVEAEIERQRQLEAEVERQRQVEAELERRRKDEAELDQKRKIEEEREQQRQRQVTAELERHRQLEAELERQRQVAAELERQKQIQAELEEQRQVQSEIEHQRQIEQELLRQRQIQAEIEQQRQIQAEIEREREMEEGFERRRQIVEEVERELSLQAKLEEKRQLEEEKERQRQIEAEIEQRRKIEAEKERQRQTKLEIQSQLEVEHARKLKVEELYQQRELQEKLEQLESKRQRQAEIEHQQQIEEELERQRQEELQWQQMQLEAELERQRQAELDMQRQKMEQSRKRELEQLQRQRRFDEEKQRKRKMQAEFQQRQQRQDAEERRRAMELTAMEAQKLREENLEKLFRTLDFPLPENLETARQDLGDFQKFEMIVENMENPPLELIEKMYDKKDKIIRCLQFYELIQKRDRIIYIHEIRKLEYELFKVTTISKVIEAESQQPHPNRTEHEIEPTETVVKKTNHRQKAADNTTNNYGYTSPTTDYYGSMSDNEVRTIFEKSTMQTQTAERDVKILANSETQTIGVEPIEPVVLVMQEPAKLLSTIQTQTPTLPEIEDKICPAVSVPVHERTPISQTQTQKALKSTANFEELKPEGPAKLFMTSQTQTMDFPSSTSRQQFSLHEESEERLETVFAEQDMKILSDCDTQTHEPSPQLLRNASCQTKLSGDVLRSTSPATVRFSLPPSKEGTPVAVELKDDTPVFNEIEEPETNSKRRMSVRERIAALNTQIKREGSEDPTLDWYYVTGDKNGRGTPKIAQTEGVVDLYTLHDVPPLPSEPSVVTTTKKIFHRYEKMSTRTESQSQIPPITEISLSSFSEPENQYKISEFDTPAPLPLQKPKKVKEYKKLFEGVERQPRNVPIQVEFPMTRKVGQRKQFFESFDSDISTPPLLPGYQISSIRGSSKYDSTNQNYESNYREHVSCHGLGSSFRASSNSPYVTFQDSRPGSGASDISGGLRPTKFVPVKFTESDYESDYEAFRIEPIWIPPSTRNRPASAYIFRTFSPAPEVRGIDFRPKSSTSEKKPKSPPNVLAKPIPMKKPIPPPKPTTHHQRPDKMVTDQMSFAVAEPISDSLQNHKQLTSTLTKTEECRFFLRPIQSPANDDDDLQVGKSSSPTYFVSVTTKPVLHVASLRDDNDNGDIKTSESYRKKTIRQERTMRSFDRSKSQPLQFEHLLQQLESTSDSILGRPKSTEFRHMIKSEGTNRPKSMEITRFVQNEPMPPSEPLAMVGDSNEKVLKIDVKK